MNTINKNYIFSPFFIDPAYRAWRFLLLAVIGIIITSSMVFVAYQDCSNLLGNRIYLICLFSCLLYAAAMLFNLYFLIPRFLLQGKYLTYSILLIGIVFLLPTLSTLQEYWVRNLLGLPHRITSYTSPLILIDNLALCMIVLICFFGTSVIALLHQWIERKEYINRMEYEHIQSEINELKGQITPGFLSKTLTNAAMLIKPDPKKTTHLLMQLGTLLRYQLYDCNRDKTLVKSEINFLDNFLSIEQINKEGFDYNIQTNGNLNNVFISPLLFISLIQQVTEESMFINLSFSLENNSLVFLCQSDNKNKPDDKNLYIIKRRLELQYPDKYSLLSETGVIELRIDISA